MRCRFVAVCGGFCGAAGRGPLAADAVIWSGRQRVFSRAILKIFI